MLIVTDKCIKKKWSYRQIGYPWKFTVKVLDICVAFVHLQYSASLLTHYQCQSYTIITTEVKAEGELKDDLHYHVPWEHL